MDCNQYFSDKTICQIGIAIVKNLEQAHSAGYIYNDLKLDNILVGNSKGKELSHLRLIDYGFASKYRKKDKTHMKEESTDVFRGNMIFASINQFKFKITSRRDDLISLLFMMVFLFNDGNLPFISEDQDSMQRN